MKMKVTTMGWIAGLVVAGALFTAVGNAQEKGAAKLLQLNASKAAPVTAVSEYKSMSCANCKDRFTTVPDRSVKGASTLTGAPTRIVAKHLCGGCANEWVVKGNGKAATSVPVHKCSSCI